MNNARETSLPILKFVAAALSNAGISRDCLHQRERELCRVGTPEYDRQLRRALEEAEAVLVLNPLIASLIEPFAQRVRVVPWGMDSSRFPWPQDGGKKAGDLRSSKRAGS